MQPNPAHFLSATAYEEDGYWYGRIVLSGPNSTGVTVFESLVPHPNGDAAVQFAWDHIRDNLVPGGAGHDWQRQLRTVFRSEPAPTEGRTAVQHAVASWRDEHQALR